MCLMSDLLQRGTDARRSLYIQLHAVLLSWNMQMTQEIPAEHRPTPAFWQAVLVCPLST